MYATLLSFPGGAQRIQIPNGATLDELLVLAGINMAADRHAMYAIDGMRVHGSETRIDSGATVIRMLCVEGG